MRDKIIQEALTWLHTPYHHQARQKGIGVDCAQFIAGIAINLGIFPEDLDMPTDYSIEWHLHNREERLVQGLIERGCIQKDINDTQPGDILCFKMGRAVGHLGLMMPDDQFIHAQNLVEPTRVVLNTLSANWKKRHVLTFSFPGENI